MKAGAEKLFESFGKLRVLIIGDVMLDSYVWGQVERISPEAPVPILSVLRKEYRLGGAANVALNIRSLGAVPLVCSVTGADGAERILLDLFGEAGISTEGILSSGTRPTSIKTRIVGHHQQLLRIDEESTKTISEAETGQLLEKISGFIRTQRISAVIFEDYDKGVITPPLIGQVTALARKEGIPVVVDPKKRNFPHYYDCTLFKPNLKELTEGMKTDLEPGNPGKIVQTARKLKEQLNARMIMVTLSKAGILIVDDTSHELLPAHVRNINDVSGAGDTVVSVATLGLAAGLEPAEFSALANLAGGLVCEKVGAVPIDREQLLAEAKKHWAS